MSHFVFMLTHGDRTVDNAAEIVPTLADTGLRYIGFKDVGADASRQRELTSLAHDAGFEVMLEVVSTTRGRAVVTRMGGRGRGRLGARRHTPPTGRGSCRGSATAHSRAGSSTTRVFCSARSRRSPPMPNDSPPRSRHRARPAGVSPSDR